MTMQAVKSPSNNPKNGQILEQSGLRRHNLGIIFRALRDSGPLSRAQLANATGMTKPGVNNIVDELLERGLLTQGAEETLDDQPAAEEERMNEVFCTRLIGGDG